MGYGIDIDDSGKHLVYGHTGGWYGVRAEVIIIPKIDYNIVVLSNYDDNGYQIVSEFFKTYFTDEKEEKKVYDHTYSTVQKMINLGWGKTIPDIDLNRKSAFNQSMINMFAFNRMYANDYKSGFNLFKMNAKLFNDSVDALKNLAKCQADLGLKLEALSNYKKALKLEPANAELKALVKSMAQEKLY